MKIRKVDDKPMVIHTKEKAKIHAHEPKGAKIKGSNIYTVERGPKTAGAKVTDTDRKKSYRKSTIHQSEPKNKGLSRFKQNLKESNTSIKTKNTNLHIAGRTGALVAGAVTDQVEGGQEVSQAAYLAYEASRPVTGTASKGAALFRKKAAAEAKKRIKKVEAGKKLAKKTAKKAAKDTAKTVAKETAKETAKTTAKVATKTATKAAATAAGTAVAPGVGTAIGMAAGYAAGVSIEVKDEKMTNRSRKIKFFLDKMKAQENQTDSVVTAGSIDNRSTGKKIRQAAGKLQAGESLGMWMKEDGTFPQILKEVCAIGEESGELAFMLAALGEYFDTQEEIAARKLAAGLEPALMVVLAIATGFIVISMYLPLLSMYGQM